MLFVTYLTWKAPKVEYPSVEGNMFKSKNYLSEFTKSKSKDSAPAAFHTFFMPLHDNNCMTRFQVKLWK